MFYSENQGPSKVQVWFGSRPLLCKFKTFQKWSGPMMVRIAEMTPIHCQGHRMNQKHNMAPIHFPSLQQSWLRGWHGPWEDYFPLHTGGCPLPWILAGRVKTFAFQGSGCLSGTKNTDIRSNEPGDLMNCTRLFSEAQRSAA